MAYTITDFAAIQNLRPFTIACFGARPNNTGSANLISKGNNNYLRDYSAFTNNQFQYRRLTSNIDGLATSNPTWTTSDGIIHIVVTVSTAGVVKIYRNGAEVSYTTTPTDLNGSLTSDAGSDLVFNLDSVSHAAIWGVDLSASDVTSLYNSGAGTNVYNVQPASILAAQDVAPSPIMMRMHSSNGAVQITNIVEQVPTATFEFNETNGTTLPNIDSGFNVYVMSTGAAASSAIFTSSGKATITAGFGDYAAVYVKGQGPNQSVQVTKTNSPTTGGLMSLHVTPAGSSLYANGYSYTLSGTTTINFYRNGTYVNGWSHGMGDPSTHTITWKAESALQPNNSLILNVYGNGTLISSYTDNSPILNGYPLFVIDYVATGNPTDNVDQAVFTGVTVPSKLYANGTFVCSQFIEV